MGNVKKSRRPQWQLNLKCLMGWGGGGGLEEGIGEINGHRRKYNETVQKDKTPTKCQTCVKNSSHILLCIILTVILC